MKRIKFEVIVTDNGVTITDRDRLFYDFAVKDSEMTDNLQCDVPKGTEDECVIHSRCIDIVRDLWIILGTLNKDAFKDGKLPKPIVSKYAELLFDPSIDYEEYRELQRRGNEKLAEEATEMLRSIEESRGRLCDKN